MQLEELPTGDVLIARQDVPRYLPIAKQTLARWTSEGRGPRVTKVGAKRVAYRASDLRAWLATQTK